MFQNGEGKEGDQGEQKENKTKPESFNAPT